MDMFNRPPAIAEDTLQYVLHTGPAFPDKCSVTALATVIDSHLSSLLPNHIWHRDAFELKLVNDPCNEYHWNLEGRMRVGDCVDDEWCVVWLLRQISLQWDVAVSVFDSDGEFLLIEAADHLPTWITPTNSENRVWIYQGRLHLVPLQYVSPATVKRERRGLHGGSGRDDESVEELQNDGAYISVSDATRIVRNPAIDTLAPQKTTETAFRRTQAYPALARQHLHRAKAYIPKDIALALSNQPALIQKATEAFYTRDAVQLRAATRMTRFPPDSAVLTTVIMTRTAYAQLVGQKFHPPKVFGQWQESEGTQPWRWRDVGMKIACGFEMLYQESKARQEVPPNGMDGSDASLEARKEALRRDTEYIKYIGNLQKVGYFKGEAEGSLLWRNQENRAAAQFITARQTDSPNRPSFASLVSSAASAAQSLKDLIESDGGEEESDDWLTVDEGTVDQILTRSLPIQASSNAGVADMVVDEENPRQEFEEKVVEQAGQLQSLADKVKKFVEGQGDVEGAKFEDDLLSDESISELSDSDDESMPEYATGEVTIADRHAAMEKLVPALDPSEYGKMPTSFHSNSQKVKEVSLHSDVVLAEPTKQHASSQPKPMRPLIFPRDQFDGVEDSDDDSEGEGADRDGDEDEEDQPIVIGEIEVDMQEEEEDFLKFSREALGISPEMWNDIVRDRKERGAFLPKSAMREETKHCDNVPSTFSHPVADFSSQRLGSELRPNVNPKLNSFEAVMQAMDAELLRAKRTKSLTEAKRSPELSGGQENHEKGKQKAEEDDEDDEDIGTAMDIELRTALQGLNEDDADEGDEGPVNYTLIKNFLESFKSQQGLSGPVGNLLGRLQPGLNLPKDEG